MAVVSATNLKGGVGKSSCCMHLGGMIAQLGRRVLLIDNDPQASLAAAFLGPDASRQVDPARTLAAVYAGDEPFAEALVLPTGFPNLDLVPGSRFAAEYNVPSPHKQPFEDQVRLRDFVSQVRDAYDLIVIDNPPTLSLATWAALAASDAWFCPLQPENFGSIGGTDVAESVALVRATINPALVRLGFVISMYCARRALHKAFADELRAAHGAAVFTTEVPHAAEFAEAVTAGKPIGHYKPKGAGARAIRALAEELLDRLAACAAGTAEAA